MRKNVIYYGTAYLTRPFFVKNCPLLGVTIGLAKELRKREEEINKYTKNRIKIVKDGGVKMKNILTQKDPFLNLKCEEEKNVQFVTWKLETYLVVIHCILYFV